MHDLLFTLPGDDFPWDPTVRVAKVGNATFEFQFVHDGRLITTDRATDDAAPAVLDAFLTRLTRT